MEQINTECVIEVFDFIVNTLEFYLIAVSPFLTATFPLFFFFLLMLFWLLSLSMIEIHPCCIINYLFKLQIF